jgi:hypothetical protein
MTTDKPDPRDAILERFERGEITKEQADAEAVAAGFGSMERSPNLAGADCFDLATWRMPQLMAWVIYRTSEAVLALAEENRIRTLVWQEENQFDVNGNKTGVFRRLRPPDKKSLFDVVEEADTRERQEGLALSAIRKRADLAARFIRGELTAYGIKRGEAEHSAIPAAAWATIDLFDEPCTHFEPEDVGRQREETPRYTDVYVISEDVRRIWPGVGAKPVQAVSQSPKTEPRRRTAQASATPVQQTVPPTDNTTVEELKQRTREIIVRRGLPWGIGKIVANELNIETRTAQRYVQEIKNDMSQTNTTPRQTASKAKNSKAKRGATPRRKRH